MVLERFWTIMIDSERDRSMIDRNRSDFIVLNDAGSAWIDKKIYTIFWNNYLKILNKNKKIVTYSNRLFN